jgi:chromosome segregation ATPase
MLWQRRTAICLQNSEADGFDWGNVLKFIGKESQRKIDLQIQGLQEQVKGLEQALRSNEYSLLGAQNELAELKPNYLNLQLEKENLDAQRAIELAETAALKKKIVDVQKRLNESIDAKTAELAQSKVDSDTLLAQLHQVQEELESIFLRKQILESQLPQYEVRTQTLEKEKIDLISQRDRKSKELVEALAYKEALEKDKTNLASERLELKAENNQLLEQLHTVQKEFESFFIRDQSLQNQLPAIKCQLDFSLKETQKLTALRDEHIKKLSEVLAYKEALEKDKTNLVSERLELKAENDQLLEQLHTVQKEFESVFIREQSLQNQLPAIKDQLDFSLKETQKLTALRDDHIKQLAEIRTAKESSHKEKEELIAELAGVKNQLITQQRELKQENDLMLLQLHQVQEELEHYFLEHEKLQKNEKIQSQRWQRVERRLPNYLDYEAITPIKVDSFSESPMVGWKVTQCTVDGLILPELEFETFLVNGKVGIRMGEVELIPRGIVVPQFRAMTSSQWTKIRAASNAIENFFVSPPASPVVLEDFDAGFWRQALMPLVAEVRALPNVFRYNAVHIKRELIHSDYEHLWLVFSAASFGQQTWPKFELRVGASNIQPGAFSKFPKLEFPRIDGKTPPFDSWFEESWDDFGGKLELRFDLNKLVSDVGVWSKVSPKDQAMLISLISLLPWVFQQMQTNKLAISRPWTDWSALVVGIIQTLQKLLLPPKPVASEKPEEAPGAPSKLPKLMPESKSKKPRQSKTNASNKTAPVKKLTATRSVKNA